jgi:hypothetical protein
MLIQDDILRLNIGIGAGKNKKNEKKENGRIKKLQRSVLKLFYKITRKIILCKTKSN